MKVLNEIVVVFHLLGMAAIVGGWLAVRGQGRIAPSIVWGARAQVVTGLILLMIAETDKEDPPNHVKLGVKLLVALAVWALAEQAAMRQRQATAEVAAGPAEGGSTASAVAQAASFVGRRADLVFWLAVLNVLVAVLWRSYD
jgi:hypothetical protein